MNTNEYSCFCQAPGSRAEGSSAELVRGMSGEANRAQPMMATNFQHEFMSGTPLRCSGIVAAGYITRQASNRLTARASMLGQFDENRLAVDQISCPFPRTADQLFGSNSGFQRKINQNSGARSI